MTEEKYTQTDVAYVVELYICNQDTINAISESKDGDLHTVGKILAIAWELLNQEHFEQASRYHYWTECFNDKDFMALIFRKVTEKLND